MVDRKKGPEMARRIWLAGIGAYGKAFEEGVDAIKGFGDSASKTTSEAFENLADKGEQIEAAAKVKGLQLASKAGVLDVDDRIKAMRERLKGTVPNLGGDDERLEAIETRLGHIEAKLDLLLKAQEKPKRATTRKTTTKKTPVKKTATKK